MKFLATLKVIILSIPAFLSGFFAPVSLPAQPTASLGAGVVQAQAFRLSGSGITATDDTITLQSFKLPDGSTNISISDFQGSVGYGTLEPNTSREEQVSFTGVTNNANGSVTLTGATRGLDFRGANCTSVVGNKHAHAGGTIFILSNTACYYGNFPTKSGTESISGVWTFDPSNLPRVSSTPTYGSGDELKFVTYGQLASTSFAGTVNGSQTQKGIYQEATNAQLLNGTAIGSTGADLIVPNSKFHVTPNSSVVVPITNEGGVLDPGFIDQSGTYTWSGAHQFNASTTFAIPPTLSTVTSSVLQTNANGVVTGGVNPAIADNGTALVSNTGTLAFGFPTSYQTYSKQNTNGVLTTIATTTLPTAGSHSNYDISFQFSNLGAASAATTSVILNGGTLFTCSIGGGSINSIQGFGKIMMQNTTTAEYIFLPMRINGGSTTQCIYDGQGNVTMTSTPSLVWKFMIGVTTTITGTTSVMMHE